MSGKSRIEKILENLLGENNVIEPPVGRDEKILYSILNDLEYTEPPHSIFEDFLLAIKNGSATEATYIYEYLTRDEKILFCKLNRLEYFEPPHSRLEKLLIKWLYLDLYLNIDGVPPFTFMSNGSPIIDYTIYGNAETSGTPTPVSLVFPSGVGEKTSNLFYGAFTPGYHLSSNGKPTSYSNDARCATLEPIDITNANTVTLSFTNTTRTDMKKFMYALFNDSTLVTRVSNMESGDAIDVSQGNKLYLCIYSSLSSINAAETITEIMLNAESTALPYEPRGYKLDISCGGTVTPIYLGEVLSTRNIKKLVLTGEEDFVYDSNYTRFRFVMPNSLIIGIRRTPVICTHYEALTDGRPIEEVINNTIYSDSARQDRWWIEDERFSSANDFKAYLAEQYSAGTPVTIWYILTEPETAIVNEPLMKIGDYTDEINYEQTAVSIPTVSGRNTFDVLGDVKPSNAEITYVPRAPLLGKRKTILKK